MSQKNRAQIDERKAINRFNEIREKSLCNQRTSEIDEIEQKQSESKIKLTREKIKIRMKR